MTKKFATRDMILSVDDLPTREIEIPEWDMWVRVRGLTASQSEKMRRLIDLERDGEEVENFRGLIAAWTLVDELGERLFSDSDADELGQRHITALDRIIAVVNEMMASVPEKKTRENFPETPDANLPSS